MSIPLQLAFGEKKCVGQRWLMLSGGYALDVRHGIWMVWPIGLGVLPPFYLCPSGWWRGSPMDMEIFCYCPADHCLHWSAWVCVGGGRWYHSPCGPVFCLCLGPGDLLLRAWATASKCVCDLLNFCMYFKLVWCLLNLVYVSYLYLVLCILWMALRYLGPKEEQC